MPGTYKKNFGLEANCLTSRNFTMNADLKVLIYLTGGTFLLVLLPVILLAYSVIKENNKFLKDAKK
jgi:hypothetical protein